MKKRTETIHIRVDKDLLNLLDKLAEQDHRKRADFIYWLLVNASCNEWANTQKVAPIERVRLD